MNDDIPDDWPIDTIALPRMTRTRILQCLENDELRTMGDVRDCTDIRLLRIPNFGKKCLRDLRQAVPRRIPDSPKDPVFLCRPIEGDPLRWKFWCPYCERDHTHSAMDGHRAAHCFEGSPLRDSGYTIKLDPEFAPSNDDGTQPARTQVVA
jgi:hypothetical protein